MTATIHIANLSSRSFSFPDQQGWEVWNKPLRDKSWSVSAQPLFHAATELRLDKEGGLLWEELGGGVAAVL
jgi:hypothetical protein